MRPLFVHCKKKQQFYITNITPEDSHLHTHRRENLKSNITSAQVRFISFSSILELIVIICFS
jgi:hypothetical protein